MSQRTLRSALESDRVALGSRSLTLSPEVVEIYGDVGLDFAWMDFEHMGESPFDSRVLERLTRAAELSGIDILARPPSADPHLIRKMVDTNVRSLLVPRVETAAEVERAVEAARFRYDGRPGERRETNASRPFITIGVEGPAMTTLAFLVAREDERGAKR